ncbi:hypothetical protein R6H00_05165, partial [Actinotignum timonense]|uniref:hypothetical protein n=1 Tax=Actinotignum timonense TaxID=1870995 RepID=UPI002A808860
VLSGRAANKRVEIRFGEAVRREGAVVVPHRNEAPALKPSGPVTFPRNRPAPRKHTARRPAPLTRATGKHRLPTRRK